MLEQGTISALLFPLITTAKDLAGGRVHPDDARDTFNSQIEAARSFVDEHESGWRGDFVKDLRQWLRDIDHVCGAIAGRPLFERTNYKTRIDPLANVIGKFDSLASSGEVDAS